MRLLFCFFWAFTLTSGSARSDQPFSSDVEGLVSDVITNYFTDMLREDIDIVPLLGGHSNLTLKIITPTADHVLRLKDKDTTPINLKRELHAMEAAVEQGVAPQIFYVSNDQRAVLMEYIKKDTLSYQEAHDPLNCIVIAQTISKIHSTPKNPFIEDTINETAIAVYNTIANIPEIHAELQDALALMERHTSELESLSTQKVNIHGELNPRNIFITEKGAVFIDWEYAGWEDPFFDLSYCALRLDYNTEEEMLFLESYLQRAPNPEELERYFLTKKIHLSQLCIYFHYFSLKFNNGQVLTNHSSPLNEISYYMEKFLAQQDSDDGLAQFYYDFAEVCLQLAK